MNLKCNLNKDAFDAVVLSILLLLMGRQILSIIIH